MKFASRLAAFVWLAAVTTAAAGAVAVDRWSASLERDFLLGTFDGTGLDAEGRIVLAPELTHLWGPESGIVWDLAPGPQGSVFVALSGPGRILSIDAAGEARVWYESDGESLITTLAADGRGGVYAGLTPEGRVLHVRAPGEVEVLVETGAAFVWALEAAGRDTLWIGTGVPGRIQRLQGDGEIETLYETGDDPVRSLAATASGGVIAGTGGLGRVLRLSADGAPFVWFDADETEIVALAVAADDTVWALAAAAAKPASPRSDAAFQGPVTRVRVTAEPPPPPADSSNGTPEETPARQPAPPRPLAGAGGALYRIDANGIEQVWRTSRGMPFDLSVGADGSVLVATGDKGQVRQIDRDGRTERLVPVASNQASALARNARGQVWIGGTSDARVERLNGRPRSSGEYLSLPVDAGAWARWGRVTWTADERGGAIGIAVRVGNTTEPDETWSEWTTLGADGQIDPDGLPAGRLLQIKVSLTSAAEGSTASPSVSALGLSYEPRNRAPSITGLQIEPPGVVLVPGPTQNAARLGPLVADDPVARESEISSPKGRMGPPVRRGWEAGVRTFSWSASDPDDDRLTYGIDVRREGDSDWHPLATGLTGTYYSWDARATPDGHYRVRLSVSDHTDNAEGEAQTRTQTSELFLIDNSRPALEGWNVERRGRIREVAFTAVDPGGAVAAVEVAMDGGEWLPLYPDDGVADSAVEHYRLTLPRGSEQELPASLRVRITDAAGNLGGEMKRVSD